MSLQDGRQPRMGCELSVIPGVCVGLVLHTARKRQGQGLE